MSEREIEKDIEDYLKKVRNSLPESLETEDLVDELRAHIREALEDKVKASTGANMTYMLKEVLDGLGSPEEIASEFGKSSRETDEPAEIPLDYPRLAARLLASFVVVVLAAWFVSSIEFPGNETRVDFWLALVVLAFFAVIEWYIRSWQASHH